MQEETYYLPVHAIRDWAGVSTALTDIIYNISDGRKIQIYEDEDNAWEVANDLLSDDDTCNVVEIKFRYNGRDVSLNCKGVEREHCHFGFFGNFKDKWCVVIKKRPLREQHTEVKEIISIEPGQWENTFREEKRKIKQPALRSLNECADLTEDDYPSDETFNHDDDCIRLLPYVLRS